MKKQFCFPLHFGIFFLLFLLFDYSAQAQESKKEQADKHLEKGIIYSYFDLTDSASYHLQIADSLYVELSLWEKSIECKKDIVQNTYKSFQYRKAAELIDQSITFGEEKTGQDNVNIGILYASKGAVNFILDRQKEKAFAEIQKAWEIFERKNSLENEEWICHHFRGIIYYFSGDIENAKKNMNIALTKLGPLGIERKSREVSSNNILGSIYRKEREYKKSVEHYNTSVEAAEQFESFHKNYNTDRLKSYTYHNLGNVYFEIGEYEKSLEYLKRVLVLNKKTLAPNDHRMATSYGSIGNTFYLQGKYKQALIQYDKAEAIALAADVPDQQYLSSFYNNKGTCYLGLKQYKKALAEFNKALKIRVYKPDSDLSLRGETLMNIGYVYKAQNKLDEAEKITLEAIELYTAQFGEKNDQVASNQNELAEIYQKAKKYDKAIAVFHQSLLSNLPDFATPLAIEEIPPAKKSFNPIVYLESIKGKAVCFYRRFLVSKNIEDLKIANHHFQKCDEVISTLRLQRKRVEDQITFNETVRNIYLEAIEVSHALYLQNKNQAYAEQALYFSERSKTQALQAKLLKNETLSALGISEDLREIEQSLRDSIATVKEKISLRGETSELVSTQGLEENLFDWQQQYEALMKQIAIEHPAYFALKLDDIRINAKAIQKELLEPEGQVVEYFISKKKLHIFHITANTFSWHVKELPAHLEQSIATFLSALYDNHILQYSGKNISQKEKIKADETYAKMGQELYQLLLDFPKQNSAHGQLIIVPDGILGNLPFEALLTEAPKQIGAYHDYPYLLQKRQISYTYSATLLQHLQNKKIPSNINRELLSFAPQFSDCSTNTFNDNVQSLRSNYFGPIQNQAEILAIQEIVGGKVMLQQEANLANFLTQSPAYAFLHIASHAKASDQNPALSIIGLSSQTNLECVFDTLSATRIANLSLPTEMIVLSACEGATGQLQKGEGIQSLAMAFTYAGAKSLCTTLWSVQDKAMADIMTNYYRHLNNGLSKDEALRKSKLDYLSAHDNTLSHPFYWAAPILIGDTQAVSFSNNSFNIPFWLYALLGLLILFLFFRWNKN